MDNVEKIGRLADRVDSLVAATRLPVPAEYHLAQIVAVMRDISAELKQIYASVSGENPREEENG